MRILMVSPYPPPRDGLANYAVQEVKRLRAAGSRRRGAVAGPVGRAPPPRPRRGPRRARARPARARLRPGRSSSTTRRSSCRSGATPGERARDLRARSRSAWTAARDVELRVHEFPHAGAETRARGARGRAACGRRPRSISRAHRAGARRSSRRRSACRPTSIALAEHGQYFERRTSLDRAEARARLGLPDDGFVFLSIGFLQPHKGFDRAVHAFAGLGRARLPARDRRLVAARGHRVRRVRRRAAARWSTRRRA